MHTTRRLTRWMAASAYEDGQRRVTALAADLDDAQLAAPVPACPDWTVRDLIAHLVGEAADTTVGDGFFAGAADAWRDPRLAQEREQWTAAQVAARRDRNVHSLLREWDERGSQLVTMLRRGDGFAMTAPDWMLSSPAADLGVHLHDLREALGDPGDEATWVTRLALGVYREWLAQRLSAVGLPALRLDDGSKPWVAGRGEPVATLRAESFELFRAMSGRRTAAQIRELGWEGDPAPYLAVISPYPLPDRSATVPPTIPDPERQQ